MVTLEEVRLRTGLAEAYIYGADPSSWQGMGFEPGAVAVHMRTRKKAGRRGRRKAKNSKEVGRILARATARPSGRFIARFRWPKARRLAMLVVQGKHRLAVSYAPRIRVRHHVRKDHHRRYHKRHWHGQ